MSVMISGSIAYDNILSYNGRFSDHLIADSLDHINLTFVTESMTRNYGGCAANIAYALKLLGGDPIVVGAVGTDGSDYLYRFDELEIKTAVSKFNDTYTAQCFITTDLTGSQLATFNPGAMNRAHEQSFPEKENITFALVGPDGRQAMINRVNEYFASASIELCISIYHIVKRPNETSFRRNKRRKVLRRINVNSIC